MKRKNKFGQNFSKKKKKSHPKPPQNAAAVEPPIEDLEPTVDYSYSSLLKTLKSSKSIMKKMLLKDDEPRRDNGVHEELSIKEVEEVEEVVDEANEVDENETTNAVDENETTNAVDEDESSDDEVEGYEDGTLSDDADEDNENDLGIKGADMKMDPFKTHFEQDLPEEIVEKLQSEKFRKLSSKNSKIGLKSLYGFSEEMEPLLANHRLNLSSKGESLLDTAHVKDKLQAKWKTLNKSKHNTSGNPTPLQDQLLKQMLSYSDLFFYDRNFNNGEEIRRSYCLHAVNHILKTRSRIIKNNAKLSQDGNTDSDNCRDQGLTRPKVLILAPFRDACLKIVNLITKLSLLAGNKCQVMQNKRFKTEYSSNVEEGESKTSHQPEDFKAMFNGNIDDCFRIGLTILRSTVKLFAQFYNADIIVASPLGLRTIIGAEGEKTQEHDFLSSIEVLIIDQADVFLMQNWEHVWHVLDHLHLTPKNSHEVDFSRVRMWTINGWSKYYRQTLLFSSFQTAELSAIFNKYCHNFSGKKSISSSNNNGSVQQVVSQIPQVFCRFTSSSLTDSTEQRFQHFINKVLPDFRGALSTSTAIFIPSYFDFVRLRNYFKKEEISFMQISEYSKRSNISRSRTLFLEKRKHFLLFTERFYFFYRYRIKGIKHIIFYGLPLYPQFYPEILNFMDTSVENSSSGSAASCTVLYSKFDALKLERILGSDRSRQLLTSTKDVHMVMADS